MVLAHFVGSRRRGASRLWNLGASIGPLKFNIDKSSVRVFLTEGQERIRRLAEKPPSSSSGLSLKNEAISPPPSSKMRTDIRTPDPLLPMNFSQCATGKHTAIGKRRGRQRVDKFKLRHYPAADGRREHHRHALGLPLAPTSD